MLRTPLHATSKKKQEFDKVNKKRGNVDEDGTRKASAALPRGRSWLGSAAHTLSNRGVAPLYCPQTPSKKLETIVAWTRPETALELRSLIKSTGELELSLIDVRVPTPSEEEVIVRMEATPLNPSD